MKNVILIGILVLINLGVDAQPFGIPDSLQNLSPKQAYEQLANEAWRLRELDREKALELAKLALAIAENEKLDSRVAQVSNYIGAIYLHYFFDQRRAIPHLHKALSSGYKSRDSTQIAYAYNNLGDAFYLYGNTDLAFEYADLALESFTQLQDTNGMAYSYVNLGLAHREREETDSAKFYFNKAYDISVETKDINRMAYCRQEIATTLFQEGQLDQAISDFKEAFKLQMKENNTTYATQCLDGIGLVYYHQNQLDSALSYFNKAESLNSVKPNPFNSITLLVNAARLDAKLGRVSTGKEKLSRAFHLADSLKNPKKLLQCQENALQFYEFIGEYEEATKLMATYLETLENAFKMHQVDIIKEITDRYKIHNIYEEAQRKLKARDREVIYGAVILALLLTLVIILAFRIQAKRKYSHELKQMNEAKDKLFSIISHDLRNPFIALSQYVDLLKEGDMTEKMNETFITDLDQKTRSTSILLENLLNLSASRTGKISFAPQEVDSVQLVKNTIQHLKSQIDHKNLKIKLDLDGKPIYGDPNMLSLVVRNILSNAIKFSHQNGFIAISAHRVAAEGIIKIEDRGVGMNKDQLASLFSSEFTSTARGTLGEKGTGIGLSLCREFVERHGGSVHVASKIGEGSTFSVYLPYVES